MTAPETLPVVSVIGRSNVGKSTLFNRILGRREAIVEERPGVTRDRKALEAEWLGHVFLLVDTGGWMPTGSDLDGKVSAQSEKAIDASDLIVMVVDGTTGITDEDSRVASILRRSEVRIVLAVNKIDTPLRDHDIWEFMSLGLGEPLGISALHSRNTGDLLDRIVEMLPASEHPTEEEPQRGSAAESDEKVPGVAIVGRPNVGKSTLFNLLIGDDRSVVHDTPGTTRDAIDTVVETELGKSIDDLFATFDDQAAAAASIVSPAASPLRLISATGAPSSATATRVSRPGPPRTSSRSVEPASVTA